MRVSPPWFTAQVRKAVKAFLIVSGAQVVVTGVTTPSWGMPLLNYLGFDIALATGGFYVILVFARWWHPTAAVRFAAVGVVAEGFFLCVQLARMAAHV